MITTRRMMRAGLEDSQVLRRVCTSLYVVRFCFVEFARRGGVRMSVENGQGTRLSELSCETDRARM
jgi:hypothetical protein